MQNTGKKLKKVTEKLYSALLGEVSVPKFISREHLNKKIVEKETREAIRVKISKDKTFMQKVLVLVFENGQLNDEKKQRAALHQNRRGFTKAQAPRGTKYAQDILDGKNLKGEDVEAGRRIAYLYAQQISEMLNQEYRYDWLSKKAA